MTRCADTEFGPPAEGVIVSADGLPGGLRIVNVLSLSNVLIRPVGFSNGHFVPV